MTIPSKHTALSIKESETSALGRNDVWVPARSVPYDGGFFRNLLTRFSLAWGVFTGRYDAVDWEESD